jgi:enoyl-CoA hydratase/carnithine racemase
MTDDPPLYVDVDGPVAILTLSRPARRNALTRHATQLLGSAIHDIAGRDDVRGVIITGAGNRAFAAGADISELVDRPPMAALDTGFPRVLADLESLPVPTVAALNGDALGGGCELALACDLRVAAAHARVGFPEVGLGIMPGAGGTRRLLQQIGIGRTKELILTGRILDASQALDWGLVNRVVAAGAVLTTAKAVLAELVERPQVALRLAKLTIDATARHEASAELERVAYALSYHGPDRAERMQRFLHQRESVLDRPPRQRDADRGARRDSTDESFTGQPY